MEKDPASSRPLPAITFARPFQEGGQEYIQLTFRSVAALKDLVLNGLPDLPEDRRSGDLVNDLLTADTCRAIEGVRGFKSIADLLNNNAKPPSVPPPPPSEDMSGTAPAQTQQRRLNPPPKPKKRPAAGGGTLSELDLDW